MIDPLRRKLIPFICALAISGGALAGCGEDETEFAADKDPLPAKRPQTSPTGSATGKKSASGENLFAQNCSVCHGERGAGGHQGPNLQTSNISDDEQTVENRIRNGKGGMPAFGDQLSDEEVKALVEYVSQDLAK